LKNRLLHYEEGGFVTKRIEGLSFFHKHPIYE
jgi:hypothetical protein